MYFIRKLVRLTILEWFIRTPLPIPIPIELEETWKVSWSMRLLLRDQVCLQRVFISITMLTWGLETPSKYCTGWSCYFWSTMTSTFLFDFDLPLVTGKERAPNARAFSVLVYRFRTERTVRAPETLEEKHRKRSISP